MANKNEQGDWIDPKGRSVPQKYVKPLDRKRDMVVELAVREALRLEAQMEKVKSKILGRITNYIHTMETELGAPRTGKGNIVLTGFSGDKQVEFKINDVITLDEKMLAAKAIIDECLTKWSEGAHKNLRIVVDQAFQVDKRGKVDTRAILGLRALNINDKKWKHAMDLIADSITIIGTRQYLQIRVRESASDKFRAINLNFSSI